MNSVVSRNVYVPHFRVGKTCVGPSAAKQSFKDECDINKIMAKYRKTGLIDHVNRYKGDYSNLERGFEYQAGLNMIIEAKDAFESLPAEIRTRFGNDPGEFLEFVHDPESVDELVALGLAKALPQESEESGQAPDAGAGDGPPAPAEPPVEQVADS